MAHYILYFAKSCTNDVNGMRRTAGKLLTVGLYGIPEGAPQADKLARGDEIIVAVGVPHRVFIGQAVVESSYHHLTEDERQRLPPALNFEYGIALQHGRVWPRAVPIERIWPKTTASAGNPKAEFRTTITRLHSPGDFALIVAAGSGEPAPQTATTELASSAVQTSAGVVTPSLGVRHPDTPPPEGSTLRPSQSPPAAGSDTRRSAIAAESRLRPITDEPPTAAAQPHASDSAVQQAAEKVILERVSERFGTAIAPRSLTLRDGAPVEVDGASSDLSILVEVFARQGAPKGGQQKKVCQDALKLITLGRHHPGARLLLVFADEQAAVYATTGTWVAEALATWGVEVLVVDVGEELRARIRQAQQRQMMVNPSGADGAMDV